MEFFSIVNWNIHQTYRTDRGTPPWIKVYRNLFSNRKWAVLSDAEKGQLVSMWILAADNAGLIMSDPEIIKKTCMLENVPNIKKFIELHFIEAIGCHADAMLTPTRRHADAPESESESETETEKPFKHQNPDAPNSPEHFSSIWNDYPCKKGKHIAVLRFKKQVTTERDWLDIQQALVNYKDSVAAVRSNGHPARQYQHGGTWFNQNWKDYIDFKEPELKEESTAEGILRIRREREELKREGLE